MPKENAYVLEVLIGQIAERRNTYAVFGKALRILGHAECFEPVRNLLHRGHQGQLWSSFWATATKSVPLTAMARLVKK